MNYDYDGNYADYDQTGVLLFMNNVHFIMYNKSISFFYFNKHLCIIFKSIMLKEKSIILTTFVKSTNNVRIDDQA